MDEQQSTPVPYGYCQCGCGEKAPLGTAKTNLRVGRIQGQPTKFILGHQMRRPVIERFFEKVNKDGPVPEHRPDLGPCWVWSGHITTGGYGGFNGGYAHRWSYEHHRGPIPDGLDLDHVCRNRGCCNPDHLEPVTPAVNSRRGMRAKLTPEQVAEIRSSTRTQRALAEVYGVAPSVICRVRTGKTWGE